MILKDATWEAFEYEVWELPPKSSKLIIASCELCGDFRVLRRADYSTFCHQCAAKGKMHTEESKALMSAAKKGDKNHFFDKKHTDESKAKMSIHHPNQEGDKNPNYNGGRKISRARSQAKRIQQLGYVLLVPLKEGEVGHHVTNTFVIGVRGEVHRKFSGYSRKKHRRLVLQWLKANDKKKYEMVLSVL